MIAAIVPAQRPPDARLLAIDAAGQITHVLRSNFPDLLRAGDVVIANDAATCLRASSASTAYRRHYRSPPRRQAVARAPSSEYFSAIVFGEGTTSRQPNIVQVHLSCAPAMTFVSDPFRRLWPACWIILGSYFFASKVPRRRFGVGWFVRASRSSMPMFTCRSRFGTHGLRSPHYQPRMGRHQRFYPELEHSHVIIRRGIYSPR